MFTFSEAKFLIAQKGITYIRYAFLNSDKTQLRKLLNHKEFATIAQSFIFFAEDEIETAQLIDSLDTYLQIYNVVGDYEESAKLLYNIVVNDEADYESENYRIIHSNYIDGILIEELSSDSYLLGSFAAWLIADVTEWPISLIEAGQKAGLYQEIGDGMTEQHIKELAKTYIQHDSYGHHFAHYDHYEHEIGTGSAGYYLFRTN